MRVTASLSISGRSGAYPSLFLVSCFSPVDYPTSLSFLFRRIITFVLLCGYSPFRSDDANELMEETIRGRIEFHERYWKSASFLFSIPPFLHSIEMLKQGFLFWVAWYRAVGTVQGVHQAAVEYRPC